MVFSIVNEDYRSERAVEFTGTAFDAAGDVDMRLALPLGYGLTLTARNTRTTVLTFLSNDIRHLLIPQWQAPSHS